MTWLAIKLFFGGMLKRLSGAAGALLRWIGRNPSLAAIIALCGLSAGLWWHYSRQHARDLATIGARDTQIAEMKDAEAKAHDAQVAVLKAKEDQWAQLAKHKDQDYETELTSARDATARYIAAHRMRVSNGDGQILAGPGSTAQDHSPGIPPAMPTFSLMVEIESADVQACGDLYGYARAAHDWAMKLVETNGR